jgi:hypothetical protein
MNFDDDHNELWGLSGWTAEYKQIGPRDYVYSIKDPKGNTWYDNTNRAGQDTFTVEDVSLDELIAHMKEKAKKFARGYAKKYAEAKVYSFDNPKPPFPGAK